MVARKKMVRLSCVGTSGAKSCLYLGIGELFVWNHLSISGCTGQRLAVYCG